MSYATRIVEKLGGTRKAAALLGIPPSTVQSWKDAGLIPAKHQQAVLAAARAGGIDLAPADFFPSQDKPAKKRRAA